MSNKIVQRIRKLQALAQSDNANEAEQAAAMARRLMVEHAIEQAEVDASASTPVEPFQRSPFTIIGLKLHPGFGYGPTRTANWKRDLVFTIASYLDLRSSARYTTPYVTFYGTKSDAEIAAYLWEVAAQQIDYAAKQWLKKPAHERSYLTGNDFRKSAVVALGSKLYALKQDLQREESTQGTALMVRKKAALNAWVDENIQFSNRKVNRGSYRHSRAGAEAGRNVKLHKGVRSQASTPKRLT